MSTAKDSVTTKFSIDENGLIKEVPYEKEKGNIDKAKSSINQMVLEDSHMNKVQGNVGKKIDEINNYNDTLLETLDPVLENRMLLGPKLLIRLFKLQKYNEKGIYVGGRQIEKMSKSELNKTLVDAPEEAQFQERGVVVKIGQGCSESFKSLVQVGDIVDIEASLFNPRNQRWLHKTVLNSKYDNYFLIPEFGVEFIEKAIKTEIKTEKI